MQNAAPVRIPPKDRTVSTAQPTVTPDDKLSELQDQLDRLKTQVRQAQQLSTLGTAAAMIAHEVNNLLTPIFNYAKTARDCDDLDLKNKALRVTVTNVEMLIAMSARVLQLSAAVPPERKNVPVREIVDDAVASLCRDFSKDSIKFSCEVDSDLSIFADRLQIQQVLFNLLLNARESMAKSHGGSLGISARPAGDRVILDLRNGGDPIPAELLSRIFEPFQSSKTPSDSSRSRCSGLGLTLCRDLVEENGGTIAVTSDRETGTTFTLTLPAATDATTVSD